MKKKEEMIRALSQDMCAFGVTVLVVMILACLIGEEAKEYSTIFSLGYIGLKIETLAQLLLLVVVVNGTRRLLFSDKWAKEVSMAVRLCLLSFLLVMYVILCAKIYGWFPLDNLKAWGSFFACIAFCMFGSSYLMAWKTDRENKEMEEALRKLKEAEKEDKEENEEEK